MKFNSKNQETKTTTNYMGHKAYKLTPEMELYTAVVTSFVDNNYYEKANARIERIKACIAKVDPLFVAKLAIYAREQMNLRSIPLVLIVELAKVHSGDNLISRTIERVVQRADELTEVLAYFQAANARSGSKKLGQLPKQLQKGLAAAFNKFDEYQFAKYDRKAEVRLRDALFLSHPKAKDAAQQALFDKIAKEALSTPFTWETEMSALGQQQFDSDLMKAEAVSKAWEEMVKSGKMGYMATLRNLRNILTKSSFAAVKMALDQISKPEAVRKSKQLPFRFLSAYEEVTKLLEADSTGTMKLKVMECQKALGQAVDLAAENIPLIAGKSLVLSDNSGSMRGDRGGSSAVSAMSKRSSADIANLFATMYAKRNTDTQIGLFGDRLVMPKLKEGASIFDSFKQVHELGGTCGPGTERGIFDMLELLIKDKIVVDNIIIFSDCQIGKGCNWYDTRGNRGPQFDKLFDTYRKQINPDVQTYSIDLRGYGNTLFNEGVTTLAGWSERLFDLVAANANGLDAIRFIQTIQI